MSQSVNGYNITLGRVLILSLHFYFNFFNNELVFFCNEESQYYIWKAKGDEKLIFLFHTKPHNWQV